MGMNPRAKEPVLYGGIEGGGTKFVCAVARSPADLIESATFATTGAQATLGQCVEFFRAAQARHGLIGAFGFSCFGPLELRPDSAAYGCMMSTPKAGWSSVNLLAPLRAAFSAPIALDTDVGGAARAEWQLGAGRGLASLAYVTVGTGIGGAVAPGTPAASRLMHAEMGHIPVRRHPRDRDFAGTCPFHGDCLEGLASGPAIVARWGTTLDALPPGHEAREIVADYLGQLATSIALMLSVERIVFGGGVMADGQVMPFVRDATARYLNGYLEPLRDSSRVQDYLCAPALGAHAGVTGALLLAQEAFQPRPSRSRKT
jgi:fructokinase